MVMVRRYNIRHSVFAASLVSDLVQYNLEGSSLSEQRFQFYALNSGKSIQSLHRIYSIMQYSVTGVGLKQISVLTILM